MRNKYLVEKLLTIFFKKLAIYKCVLYQGCDKFACYIDGGIFASTSKQESDQSTKDVQSAKLNIRYKVDL